MSQLGTNIPRPAGSPSSNVYTVLAVVAALALLAAVVFVWVRSTELTGNSNPFFVDKDIPAGMSAR